LNVIESILIVAGLAMNIFLIGQYEGTMVRSVRRGTLGVICLIVFAFESLSMLLGYYLTSIPFFAKSSSEDLKSFCYFVAGILFLMIAAYMITRAVKHELIQERLQEIGYMRIILEVLLVALFTFMAGIGWGFIGHSIFSAAFVVGFATIVAMIAGVYTGFHQGCRFRYGIYGIGGCMLAFVGIDILIWYL